MTLKVKKAKAGSSRAKQAGAAVFSTRSSANYSVLYQKKRSLDAKVKELRQQSKDGPVSVLSDR
jgi:anti-sigma28 factor (negative regulator of flagellin synthesis)